MSNLDSFFRFGMVEAGALGNGMNFSRFSFRNHIPRFLTLALFGTVAGCGEDSPPYEVLPLRDALQAAPEVVATLSDESRHDLALRLREAQNVEPETLTFEPESLDLEKLVTSADALREASNQDAIMLGQILATDKHRLLEIHSVSEKETSDSGPIEIVGKVSDVVAPFEEAALHGEAGKTLRVFVARTHAQSVVRMTGLPMAAVAWNDKVYVNESWLVAMSSLEDVCPAAPASIIPGQTGTMPGLKPLSVDFNPFDIPANLSECSAQVTKTCSCATNQSCTHNPTDITFANANDECTWVNQQPEHAAALCVMALYSLGNVRECIDDASPSCNYVPVNNRAFAVGFVTDTQCVGILDACLRDGNSPSADGTSSKCGDSCNDCKYCDGKGNDCSECASDANLWATTCEACIQICAICADSSGNRTTVETPFQYAAVRPVTQCSVRTPAGRSPLPAPVGTAFWLFAPVAYLLSRRRR